MNLWFLQIGNEIGSYALEFCYGLQPFEIH
jgi:hypothetical protein